MKKSFLKVFFCLLLLLNFINGCSSDPQEPIPNPPSLEGEYIVNFLIEPGNIYTSIKVRKSGENKGVLTKPATPPTKEGFTFAGWYSDSSNTRLFNFSSDRITSDTALYAKWFTTYIVTFSTPKGASTITPIKVLKKDFLELPNPPVKEYSKFVDWYLDGLFNQRFNKALPILKDITLYAKFETEVFNFVFYNNGGSKVATQEIKSGETASKPTVNPTKEDYFFIGWYSNPEGKGNEFDFEGTKIIKRSWVYAVWANKVIIVTYNANGGTIISDKNEIKEVITEKKKSGSVATFKRPQDRTTLQFVHWCTDPELLVEYDFSKFIKSDFVLYAKWEPKTFDISFENLNGASAVQKQKVGYGKTVKKPNTPTKEFSAFLGWYTSLDFDVAYNFETPVFENKKLYAYFLLKRLITFDPRGGFMIDSDKTQLVTQGTRVIAPKPPVKENYAFVEWVSDNVSFSRKYNFSTPVNANFTLYAKWVANVATLTKLTIYKTDNPNANFKKDSYSSNNEGNVIRLTAPGINLSNIIPRFNTERVIGSPSPPLDAPQDFSYGPIVYKLPTESGSITTFKVEISNFASTKKSITLFKIRNIDNVNIINSTITANISGNTIYLILPKGIDPSKLRPYIETSFGSTINPLSGSFINRNQLSYVVTAEDNSSETYNLDIQYIKSSHKDITSFSFNRSKNKDANDKDLITPGIIESRINGNDIYITLPEGSRVQRLTPTVSITGNALSPNSDEYQDFQNTVRYTVVAEDNSTKIYTVHITVTPSSNNKITLFSFRQVDNPSTLTQDYIATINQNTKVIETSLPDHIDLTNNRLTPLIITEPYIKDISPKGALDYSVSSLKYTVTAENGNKNIYSIHVKKVLSSVKNITSFSFESEKNSTYLSKDYNGVIIGSHIHIGDVPHNINISNLKPSLTFVGGGAISPSISLSQDFSNIQNPVKYTITARDGSLKTYTILMDILPNPSKQITSFIVTKDALKIPGQIIGNNIILTIFENRLPIENTIPTILYKGKSISPNGQAITINKNSNITYTVTGSDKNPQVYKLQVISYESNIAEVTSFSLIDKSKTILDRSYNAIIDNKKSTITINELPETALSANVDTHLFFKGKSSSYPSESTADALKSGNITITITPFDDSVSKSYAVIINTVKSDKKSITSFVFDPKKNKTILHEVSGIIDSKKNTITADIPFGTNVSSLLPSVNIVGASYEPVDSQSFGEKNVEYIVYADNQSRRSYLVNLNFLPNTKAEIISFSFNLSDNSALTESLSGTIKDPNSSSPEINILINPNIPINHLKPSITLSEGAKISPAIDYVDFGKPASYTVTSQDEKTTKTYVVKIVRLSEDAKDILSFKLHPSDNANLTSELTGKISAASHISLTVPYGSQITNLLPRIQTSGVSYTPTGRVNFLGENGASKIVSYTITAQNGSKKIYTVVVNIQKPIHHSISFSVGDGASSIAPITVNDGDTIPSNISTQRSGYIFSGWYTDKNQLDDERYLVNSSTVIKSDLNLFAKWKLKTYTINFMSEGKSFLSKTITSQENLTSPNQLPSKPSYKFKGWYENESSPTASPYNNFGHPVTKSFSLYARFEKDVFVIKYISLGKTYQKFIRQGSAFEVPTEVVNPNHDILGFYKNASFTSIFDFKNELVKQDEILYVKWGNTVTLDPNASHGGKLPSNQPSSIKIELNQKISEPANPTNLNTNLTFLGWFIGNTAFDFNTIITSNITLTARWGYQVTFNANGGHLVSGQPSSIKIELNQKILKPTTPTNSNATLTFLGWFKGSVKFNFETIITSSITLTAKWGYEVTLNAGTGGTLAFRQINPIGVVSGESLKNPLTPINRDGNLNFIGWFKDNNKITFPHNIGSSTTLIAKWGYPVTFDAGAGGRLDTQLQTKTNIIEKGHKVPELNNSPTKTGYAFLGWFNGNTAFDFNTLIASNITLTAKWGYQVTFNANGGLLASGQVSPIKILPNQKISKPANPNKANLTFLGWFNGHTAFDFNTLITSNITLTAKWGYQVTLDAGTGGTLAFGQINLIKVAPNQKIFKPANPTNANANLTFLGWFNGSTAFDFNAIITSSITLTAKWGYQVTLDANGGLLASGQVSPIKIAPNQKISKPTNPTNANLTFLGWFNGNTAFDFNAIINSNITLTAKWGYEITLNAGTGGSLAFGQINLIKVAPNQKISKPANPTNANANLTFLGWFNGNTAFDFNTLIVSNITLTAKWGYQVTLDANGGLLASGQVSPIKIAPNQKISKPTNPTNANLTFLGWFNGNTAFDFNTLIVSNITLTAKWGYQVTFNANGGLLASGQVSPIKIAPNQKISKPTNPTNANLTFLGWFNGNTAFDFNTLIVSNITLTAKWGYQVTFNANGGLLASGQVSPIKIEPNQKISKPTNPTNANLTFLGWFNGNTAFDFNTLIVSNITLTAKWGYQVTLDANGGLLASGQVSPIKIAPNQKISKPTNPTNANLTFLGWFNGNTAFDFNTLITSNITLTAKWGYQVTLDANGGLLASGQVSPIKIAPNQKISKPDNPTNANLTFLGWFNGNTAFDFNAIINSNITLTAKWGYQVTFNANGGLLASGQVSPIKIEPNQKISKPASPTNANANLTFLGWFNGNNAFDFNTLIVSNITLTAKWGYQVTLDANGGLLASGQVSPIKIEPNQKISKPASPTNTNAKLTFLGWFNGNTAFDFNTLIASNITLTAKWGYQVTLDANGGLLASGQVSPIKIAPNQKISKPTNPTNTNAKLTFLGWFNGNTAFDFNTLIASNITLTAKWGYQVTFNANGGVFKTSSGNKQTLITYISQGDFIKNPQEASSALFNDPTKKYKIIKWTTDSSNTHVFDLSTEIIDENIELYALWGYHVTFQSGTDGIFGKDNNNNDIVSQLSYASAGNNSTISLPSFPNARYTKTSSSYEIIGWTDANNSKVTFPKAISNNEVFTAKWGFKVTLDADGGTFTLPDQTPTNSIMSTTTVQIFGFTEASLLENIPNASRAFFDFLGWTVNGANFDFSITQVTSSITAKAKWKSNLDIPALEKKLLPSNRRGLGSASTLGTIIRTSNRDEGIASSVNTYLTIGLTALELKYILANRIKYRWDISYGDFRLTHKSRFSTMTLVIGENGIRELSLIEPYQEDPYNFKLKFNYLNSGNLNLTDAHYGETNAFGAIRGMTITKK